VNGAVFDIPGIWITVIGIVLNFTGSLMMSIEAIGARQFLQAREEQRRTGVGSGRLALTAAVDNTATYLFFSVLSFALLTWLAPMLGFSVRFLLSWVTYFLLHVLARTANLLNQAVKRMSPAKLPVRRERYGCVVAGAITVVWLPVYVLTWLLYVALKFGFELPLCALSEKVVLPVAEKILGLISHEEEEMARWQFKRPVFYGFFLNTIGFLTQLVGVVVQIHH
jgi:hypothetical protein